MIRLTLILIVFVFFLGPEALERFSKMLDFDELEFSLDDSEDENLNGTNGKEDLKDDSQKQDVSGNSDINKEKGKENINGSGQGRSS